MLIYRPKEWTALDMFYLHTKFGDFRINCSGGMIGGGASKLKMSHLTLTTPLLGVVCHP